jgi:putative SOS response-associated peptidase YedK
MCGRFTLRASPKVIAEQFALFEMPDFAARFNIAPSQAVPIVRLRPGEATPRRELVLVHWGLIPPWAEDPSIGNRLINARAETAGEKPAFRKAMRERRCLVVADGFYEWQGRGRNKRPYLIRLHGDRPFGFGGLWESWEGPDHRRIESCTVLTTDANDVVRPIHDRMPVIVAPEDYGRWLDPTVHDPRELAELLRPFPSPSMEAIPVSTRVNSPAHDDPACVGPLEEQKGFGFEASGGEP